MCLIAAEVDIIFPSPIVMRIPSSLESLASSSSSLDSLLLAVIMRDIL